MKYSKNKSYKSYPNDTDIKNPIKRTSITLAEATTLASGDSYDKDHHVKDEVLNTYSIEDRVQTYFQDLETGITYSFTWIRNNSEEKLNKTIDDKADLVYLINDTSISIPIKADYAKPFGFDKAINLIKQGQKVKRHAWGGYWFLPDDSKVYHDGILQSTYPIIMAKLKEGGYAPAQPYMADLLAEDWELTDME